LEALLALPTKPTFNDYLTLQIQDRSLRSSVRTVKGNGVYKIVFQDGLWLMAIFIHLGPCANDTSGFSFYTSVQPA
jgi:hypothetical protein